MAYQPQDRQGPQSHDPASTGYWLALFYTDTGGHRQVTVAGTGQASTPWAAVQRAAWAVVKGQDEACAFADRHSERQM